jgi:hypothetical protein
MNIKKHIIHFQYPELSGFSVVEVILAAAIFLIFSGASIVLVLQGFDTNRTATEIIVANQYAIEGIEAVRSIRNQSYANLIATAGTGLARVASGPAFVWAFSGTQNQFGPNNMYTRVISISSVYRDSITPNGNIVNHLTYPGGGTLDPNTMKATATVTWNVSPTRHDSVVQTTYFTNWRVNAI